MNPQERFDMRIAEIHGLGGVGDGSMNVKHEEFMAMADAFLGSNFDKKKLEAVETLQTELHVLQLELFNKLNARKISRSAFVDESNKISDSIARRCEKVLGPLNFRKLFGAVPSELAGHIDKEAFLSHG